LKGYQFSEKAMSKVERGRFTLAQAESTARTLLVVITLAFPLISSLIGEQRNLIRPQFKAAAAASLQRPCRAPSLTLITGAALKTARQPQSNALSVPKVARPLKK